MSKPISRRKSLKALAIGSVGLGLGTAALAQTPPAPKPVIVADLAKSLAKLWDVVEFKFDDAPALLVRVPEPPKNDLRTSVFKRTVQGKSETVYAVAYLMVCTHQGCRPANPTAMQNRLVCPCHGSQYDGKTGNVVQGPARVALAAIKLEQRQQNVVAVGFM